MQARKWSETDILTPQQVTERRSRALRTAFSVRASEQIKSRKAASWTQPTPEPESMQPRYATGERAIAQLHQAYSHPPPGLLRLEMERNYRPPSRGTLERLALQDRSDALGGADPEADLEPEPEQPAYLIESAVRIEQTRAALAAANDAARMAKAAAEDLRERLSEASKKAFERVDTDKSGEIDK
eukprot:COSAG05_NODE_1136_length_5755_cov_4.734441_3_plen_185_part_00